MVGRGDTWTIDDELKRRRIEFDKLIARGLMTEAEALDNLERLESARKVWST